MTLNDEILRATGGPTINDGQLAYFLAQGGTGTALNDVTRSWLLSKIVAPTTGDETTNDLWMIYLTEAGYTTGTLNDRQLAYWTGLPTPP
jgi:hypothetical protein